MFTKELTVTNKTGLHARPAGNLVQLAKKYSSKIEIIVVRDGNEVIIDAKSIINVMAGGLSQGTNITLRVTGDDEDKAGADIVNYIENLTE